MFSVDIKSDAGTFVLALRAASMLTMRIERERTAVLYHLAGELESRALGAKVDYVVDASRVRDGLVQVEIIGSGPAEAITAADDDAMMHLAIEACVALGLEPSEGGQ